MCTVAMNVSQPQLRQLQAKVCTSKPYSDMHENLILDYDHTLHADIGLHEYQKATVIETHILPDS
jgi:hypothetical protein